MSATVVPRRGTMAEMAAVAIVSEVPRRRPVMEAVMASVAVVSEVARARPVSEAVAVVARQPVGRDVGPSMTPMTRVMPAAPVHALRVVALAVDVAARVIELVVEHGTLARPDESVGGEAPFGAPDVALLADQPCGFAAREIARGDALLDAIALVGLAVVDTRLGLGLHRSAGK